MLVRPEIEAVPGTSSLVEMLAPLEKFQAPEIVWVADLLAGPLTQLSLTRDLEAGESASVRVNIFLSKEREPLWEKTVLLMSLLIEMPLKGEEEPPVRA